MRNLFTRILPPAAAVVAAAILAHFVYHSPPDLTGALAGLPAQIKGDWAFPVDAAMGLLAAAVLWFDAFGLGCLILYRSDAIRCLPTLWSRWVFAPLTGWIVISLSVLMMGLAGLAERWALGTMTIVYSAMAVFGWSHLIADLRIGLEIEIQAGEEATSSDAITDEDHSSPHPAVPPGDAWGGFRYTGLSFFLIGGLYLLIVPYALTPAVESDELRYHLAAPAAWLHSGSIHYLPHQAFSNFPFLVEMLYMLAMSLQGTEGARMVHLTFLESCGILVALLGYFLIRLSSRQNSQERDQTAQAIAGFAGLGFVLIPCATILGAWAFIDLAMTAYFLAVAYLAALALAGAIRPPAWFLGLMIGGALGTKYSMAPLMIGMLSLLLVLGWMRGGRRWRGDDPVNFRYVFSAGLVSLALASPWFIKNWVWTGNPFYPLAYSIFGGGDWSEQNAAFYAAKAAEKGLRALELYEMAARQGWLVPLLREPGWGRIIELMVSPISTSLMPDKFEGHFLGPMPLTCMMLGVLGGVVAFVRERSDRAPKAGHLVTPRAQAALLLWVAGVVAGSWLFWFLTYQSNRMLLPTMGLVLAAGAWGFMQLSDPNGALPAPRAMRAIVLAGLLYAFLHTSCSLLGSTPREVQLMDRSWRVGSARFGHPLPVAWGLEPPETYVERRLEYAAAARWLNKMLSPDHRALLIGEHRTLWFDGNIVASDWFDTPQPLPMIRATADNDALFQRLRSEKVRYIFFNREELSRYAPAYFMPRFTPEEYARFESLMGFASGTPDPRLKEIFKDPNYDIRIYEILPE